MNKEEVMAELLRDPEKMKFLYEFVNAATHPGGLPQPGAPLRVPVQRPPGGPPGEPVPHLPPGHPRA